MQAVILAAGQGLRIREHFVVPKGFIEINGKPLIMQSIQKLKSHGINEIFIITGYGAEKYKKLENETGLFKTVYNPHFDKFNNVYSLYLAKNWVKCNFILLESDIVFEEKAIATLINNKNYENQILVTSTSNLGDEVYVEVDSNNLLKKMAKNHCMLKRDSVLGEFVGITKFSYSTFRSFIEMLEQSTDLLFKGHYDEDGLTYLSEKVSLNCCYIPNLKWSEIDNIAQFRQAEMLDL